MMIAPVENALTDAPAPPPKAERIRLDFLDGLRGLAALYVALYHAWLFAGYDMGFAVRHYSLAAKACLKLLQYGHYSVAVFIVLSGFVLGVPAAQTADKILKGGVVAYIKRRARRILPPYYAALFLFVLLIALTPLLQTPQHTAWDSKIPVTPGSFLSHLFLVHNLRADWRFKIDGPLWSVATEWQIYFLYPAILLPVWRRLGFMAMALIGFAVGMSLPLISRIFPALDVSGASPQYAGLFAFGVAASAIAFSQESLAVRLRERVSWKSVSLAALILLIGAFFVRGDYLTATPWAGDTLVGLVLAIIIVHYTLQALN